jgi:phosphoglycolate phosphatase
MRYRLCIFDFDGTLVDSFPWFLRVVNDVADKYRFKRIEPHNVDALRGLSAREMIRHLGVPAWKLPLIANDMRKRKSQALASMQLFPGVPEMLHELSSAGVTLAIASSDSEANVRGQLGPDLAGLIAIYECGASLFGKAAKFRKVLGRSGHAPQETISIGDEIRDIEAARAAGIACAAVGWGYTRSHALDTLAPDEHFRQIDDIAPRLLQYKSSLPAN